MVARESNLRASPVTPTIVYPSRPARRPMEWRCAVPTGDSPMVRAILRAHMENRPTTKSVCPIDPTTPASAEEPRPRSSRWETPEPTTLCRLTRAADPPLELDAEVLLEARVVLRVGELASHRHPLLVADAGAPGGQTFRVGPHRVAQAGPLCRHRVEDDRGDRLGTARVAEASREELAVAAHDLSIG